MKYCPKCNRKKSKKIFHKKSNAPDGLQGICKDCKKILNSQSNPIHNPKNNPKNNPKRTTTYLRDNVLKNKYPGLGGSRGKRQMYIDQNARCSLFEVCGNTLPKDWTKAHVDHDHSNGRVRGLLCPGCNIKMAAVDNESWLKLAIEYRNKFRIPSKDELYPEEVLRNPISYSRLTPSGALQQQFA